MRTPHFKTLSHNIVKKIDLVKEISHMALTGEHQHPDIKIFVSAHKPAVFPEGNSILPCTGWSGPCRKAVRQHAA